MTPDESVVRLVWGQFLRPGSSLAVLPVAFKPRANETDGISVFRAACLAEPADALAAMLPDKRHRYAIAVIPVAELTALGRSVVPAKVDAAPGHAVVPELNITAVDADGTRWKTILIELARLAARNLTPPAGGPGS